MNVARRQACLDALAVSEHAGCLMCGAGNDQGLRLRFEVQPDGSVVATFQGGRAYRSYSDTLHGGVISALLDAAMTNVLFSMGIVGLTAELTVRFLAPAVPEREAVVRAAVDGDYHPLFYMRADLTQDGELKARATGKFIVKDAL